MPDSSVLFQRTQSGVSANVQRAVELACRYLDRRERTESDVRDHLDAKGIDASAVDIVVDMLTDQGYLDDERYARLFAEDKRHLEEWGNDRIRWALRDRGLDLALVSRVLAEEPASAELARALALLRRRFPGPLRDHRERERALAVLLRKGYDSELALDAVAAHMADALP